MHINNPTTRITTSLAEIKALYKQSDKCLRSAVGADIQQYFTDALTPDRNYGTPIDNVKKEFAASREAIERLLSALEHEMETSVELYSTPWPRNDQTLKEEYFTRRRAELAVILTGEKP